jgi:HEAT repeat protein
MGRRLKLLLLTQCLWAAWLVGVHADGAQTSGESEQLASPTALVRQLGDPRFSVRKRAMEQLVELGVEAIAALEEGVQSNDREVSFRSRRALDVVREHDFQRRLRAFAAGQDAQETYELPGWAMFRNEVGDGLEARRLFVEMQQAEPQLLQALARSPVKAVEALVDRLEEIQQAPRTGRKTQSVSLGTVATLLFVSNQDRGESVGLAGQNLSAFYRQDVFAAAIQSGSQREILRKMLGSWIENARSWDGFHAMLLAMQFDLPQGLAPAKRMLESDAGDPNQAVYRGFALQTIARFGDESHIPILEPLLEDASPYGGTLAISGKAKYQTQIRDIALAALVHLAKQDPKKFGLLRLKPSSTQVFNTNSVAFEDDAKREEAITKWREFRTESH